VHNIPLNKVFLEKLVYRHLTVKSPTSWRFTNFHSRMLHWGSYIQPLLSPLFLRSTLTLSYHLCLCLQVGSFLVVFWLNFYINFIKSGLFKWNLFDNCAGQRSRGHYEQFPWALKADMSLMHQSMNSLCKELPGIRLEPLHQHGADIFFWPESRVR
jgi:hypothetical protein